MSHNAKIVLVVSVSVAMAWALYIVQAGHALGEDYTGWSCERLAQFARDDGTRFLRECESSHQAFCTANSECGSFPCVDGRCLVKPCEADSACPNGLCGLNATPVPGFCTTIDVM